jgi:uncharacterized protein (DUF58 family)
MSYKGKHSSKFQYAQYVAASLAYLMLHQRDAVGLVLHDTRVRQMIPAKASSKHLLRVIRALEMTKPGGETELSPIWHDLAGHQLRRRGMVIILSDCFDDTERLLKALQHFRHKRHEVLLFHVLAPEEVEFPFHRMTQFRNLELIADKLLVDPNRLRAEYLKNFREFCRVLREKCGHMKIDYFPLRTDEPVEKALGIYLTRRQRQK